MSFLRYLVLSLSTFAFLCSQSSIAEETTPEKVMVVFDASGSMWGQVGGKTKIEIAKAAVNSLADEAGKDASFGLMAYGHRRKGDCTDIETLVAMNNANAKSLKTAVKNIDPKGKTPLSDAVVKAAEELKFAEQRATVILVSDGIESCDKDPCAIAEELEKKGVDFTAHIIGFDVASKDQAGLKCIAENTGGRFFAASDLKSLKDSLKVAVAKTVDPTGVKLVAKMSEESEPIEKVAWTVFKPEIDIEGKRERVTYSYHAQPIFRLDAGKYLVHAKTGNATAERDIEVLEGKNQTEIVILGAGRIKLRALQTEGGEALSKLAWTVWSTEQDFNGKRTRHSYSYNDNPIFSLPAGDYVFSVKSGNATAEKVFTVEAGKDLSEDIIIGSGFLKAKAIFSEGGEQVTGGLSWTVVSPEVDFDGKRTKFAHSYNDMPTFSLPAGKYKLQIKRGATHRSEDIEIVAGQEDARAFNINAALVRAKLFLKEGGERVTSGTSWDVLAPEMDFDGKRDKYAHSYNHEPVFTLPAGKYLVQVKRGASRASKEIEVVGGDKRNEEVYLNSGLLRTQAVLSEGNDQVSGGLSWNIVAKELDFNGKRAKFAHSYNDTPDFTLPAGEYFIQVKRGNTEVRKPVTIEAGGKTREVVSLEAALVNLKAVETPGTNALDINEWTIFDTSEERKRIAHSYNDTPQFTLPAGEYLATARLGQRTEQQKLVLAAGGKENVEVVLSTSEE